MLRPYPIYQGAIGQVDPAPLYYWLRSAEVSSLWSLTLHTNLHANCIYKVGEDSFDPHFRRAFMLLKHLNKPRSSTNVL